MNTKVSTRVAVTGLGIITAVGESLLAFEEGIFNGKCGIGPVSLFDTTGFSVNLLPRLKKKIWKTVLKPGKLNGSPDVIF